MHTAQSKNGVPIRLTEERGLHITEEHSEMAGYYFDVLEEVQGPAAIYEGKNEALLAIRELEPGRCMVLVYRELSANDRFGITAFLTSKIREIERRTKLWPP